MTSPELRTATPSAAGIAAERPGFDWSRVRQLSLPGVLLAFAVPSAIAFGGFHWLLPGLVAVGAPKLLAWCLVAAAMLLGLALTGLVLNAREAGVLGIRLSERLLLRRITGRQWLVALGVLLGGLVLSLLVQPVVVPLLQLFGAEIPDYLPFWLDPAVNPANAAPEALSPGYPLAGNVAFLAVIAVTLLLNVLAEELYFRAWLLPKMQSRGTTWAWGGNGALFALYHTFQLWLLPVILVVSLASAFVVQRTRSIWPAFIVHLVANFLMSVAGVALLVLG